MALIKSISGIRGTIGGIAGQALTPIDITRFASAYGTWLKRRHNSPLRVVTGRDARLSGEMVSMIVNGSLRGIGIDVTDIGMATTPTVEMAVTGLKAQGGIIVTASHNPAQWNALKLLNERGEFLDDKEGREVLQIADTDQYDFAEYDKLGSCVFDDSWGDKHIEAVTRMSLVDCEAIRKAEFTVAIDAVSSVGGRVVPELLKALGVKRVIELYCEPTGLFPHNPEPLPEHLGAISSLIMGKGADVGFVVDPDVDRLAVVCENGAMFGEEYTLVAVSDWVLQNNKGPTVSNMSSSKALKDVTESHQCNHTSSEVGEVNVVREMKRVQAVIGGEGNGGVIYPALHYGRDALAGIALFLTHLARSGVKCSDLRRRYPDYFIAKKKMDLTGDVDMDGLKLSLEKSFPGSELDTRDGIKVSLPTGWVQIRRSNTEPIIRVYAEEKTMELASALAEKVIALVKKN